MKVGDRLICKRTCYDFRDAIYPSRESPNENVHTLGKRVNNYLFRKPIYRKGKSYEIEFIFQAVFQISRFSNNDVYLTFYTIRDENGTSFNREFNESIISNAFVTPMELRKLKLEKIRKKSETVFSRVGF